MSDDATNQRSFPRNSLRTLVTVLCDDDPSGSAPKVYKAWTEDISPSGMQFACNDELPPGKIYVRLLLPELEDKLLECSVVRSGRREPSGLLSRSGPRYVYGVRFDSIVPADRFRSQLASGSDRRRG